uniref:Uncharacterized protein n=1 Tax=Peronospora matthiolae TaxID=2874970 RepID=A0AAV1U6U3_9STRA
MESTTAGLSRGCTRIREPDANLQLRFNVHFDGRALWSRTCCGIDGTDRTLRRYQVNRVRVDYVGKMLWRAQNRVQRVPRSHVRTSLMCW